jgi:hypothetical protein
MAKNRFEQVDTPQPDAITLWLQKQDDGNWGTVTVPAALTEGKFESDRTSDRCSVVDAFRSAIHLANEIKAAVVVMDPDSLWQAEWGELYRPL